MIKQFPVWLTDVSLNLGVSDDPNLMDIRNSIDDFTFIWLFLKRAYCPRGGHLLKRQRKYSKWIFDVRLPGNLSGFGISSNDFWSRFTFHSLSSKILKIPGFNLKIDQKLKNLIFQKSQISKWNISQKFWTLCEKNLISSDPLYLVALYVREAVRW